MKVKNRRKIYLGKKQLKLHNRIKGSNKQSIYLDLALIHFLKINK